MQLEELQRVREAERSTDSLQHLADNFYVAVGAFLDELRDRRDELAAQSNDPFTDPDVRAVGNELKTATRIVESLYERRVGKIVKLASFAAADMQAETDGLTREERVLFDALVADIRDNRRDVLEILEDRGEDRRSPIPPEQDDGAEDPAAPEDASGDPATATETTRGIPDSLEHARSDDGSSTSSTQKDEEPSNMHERTTVRITEDVGEIVGVDEHAYELATDDIVSLPTDNARPLIERGVADVLK